MPKPEQHAGFINRIRRYSLSVLIVVLLCSYLSTKHSDDYMIGT